MGAWGPPTSLRGRVVVGAGLLAIGLAVRVPFLDVVSGDYTTFVSRWVDHLAGHGVAGLADQFANYEPLYLYLLLATTVLPLPKLLAVKAVSIAFDLALAYLGYRIVDHHRRGTWWPYLAAAAVLVTPTVVLNSAAWAQCDAIYAAFCLLALDALMRRRPVWAAIWLGLGIAAKPQAVFLLPVALIVVLVHRQSWRRVLAAAVVVPAVFVVTLLPAVAAGASLPSLLTLYPDQLTTAGVGWSPTGNGAGTGGALGADAFGPTATHSPAALSPLDVAGASGPPGVSVPGRLETNGTGFRGGFTYNAANFYQWLPTDAADWWRGIGYGLAGAGVVLLGAWAARRRDRLDGGHLLLIASALAISTPFFLPSMHDRYSFLADVLTVVVACVVPRAWPAAILMQLASGPTYLSYLWGVSVPFAAASAAGALALAWTVLVLLTRKPSVGPQDVGLDGDHGRTPGPLGEVPGPDHEVERLRADVPHLVDRFVDRGPRHLDQADPLT